MTFNYFVWHALALFTLGNMCQCANVLYISTLPSPSHNIWGKTLAMGLAGRNHKITFLTHSPNEPTDNFTPIIIEGMYEHLNQKYNYMDWLDYSTMRNIREFFDFCTITCAFDLESEAVQTLIAQAKSGIKYDLIIMDQAAGHCLYPLIELFGSPPVVGVSPYGLAHYLTFAYGLNLNIAYNPVSILPYTDKMSLWERANNFFYTMVFLYYRHYHFIPAQQNLAEAVFGKDIKPLHEVEKTFSLLLTNTDPVLHYPQPVPPAIIQVGGLHTRRAKSLTKDLLQYLDESKHGVIYFAFGTNIRSDGIEPEKIQALLDAFSQLKENVLWKFESDLPNLPRNVLIKKWMPQNDILAHPKVKLFITHGGGLSTQEAMYHGVPVVGVPFFVDQHVNMRKMVVRKLGVQLDYKNITAQNSLSAINEVLNNDVYKKNAQAISRYYKDKPQDALDTAIFWVEYVLRHGGAEHLSIAARDMPFYQVLLLDILGIVALAVLLVIFLVTKVIKSGKQKEKVKQH